jgi:hypothetical protein
LPFEVFNIVISKLGDKAIWKPLIAQNMDALIEHTLNGDAHPKNGGCKHEVQQGITTDETPLQVAVYISSTLVIFDILWH